MNSPQGITPQILPISSIGICTVRKWSPITSHGRQHSLHYGQETYWKGVLGHDLEPNRFYYEVRRTAHELQKIGPKLVNLKIKNRAAILYNRASDFGISYMPIKEGNVYMEVVRQMHRAAFRNNIGVDFVLAENADFTGYDLLLVPPLYVAGDELLKKISDFVKNGGHVIMSVKSGFCDENSVVRHVKAPGPLKNMPYPLVIRQGTNDMDKTIRYYLNYSGNGIKVSYNYEKGVNLFSG